MNRDFVNTTRPPIRRDAKPAADPRHTGSAAGGLEPNPPVPPPAPFTDLDRADTRPFPPAAPGVGVPPPSLPHVDWEDLVAVTASTDGLLTGLDTDRDQLRHLAALAITDRRLLALCRHHDGYDSLVLHVDPAGWCLALEVIAPGYSGGPHHHPYPSVSRVIAGRLTYTPHPGATPHSKPRQAPPGAPVIIGVGGGFATHHTVMHTVRARASAVVVTVRGPTTGAGVGQETGSGMDADHAGDLIDELINTRVLTTPSPSPGSNP